MVSLDYTSCFYTHTWQCLKLLFEYKVNSLIENEHHYQSNKIITLDTHVPHIHTHLWARHGHIACEHSTM